MDGRIYFETMLSNPDTEFCFKKGQIVRVINKDVNILERLHVAEACRWNPKMEHFIGLVGKVSRKTADGYVRVAFYSKSASTSAPRIKKWTWYPASLAHVDNYNFVRQQYVCVLDDRALLMDQNKSVWTNEVEKLSHQLCGQLAQVCENTSSGKVFISMVESRKVFGISQVSLVPVYDAKMLDDHELAKEFRLKGRFGDPNIPPPFPQLARSGNVPELTLISAYLMAAQQCDAPFLLEFTRKFPDYIDVLQPETQQTALMIAASSGHNTIVHLLCMIGANMKLKDVEGLTAVHHAVQQKQHGTLDVLLSYSAPVDSFTYRNRWSPLHLAVITKSFPCFRVLVNKEGTDVNAQDSSGNTVFHLCIEYQCNDMLDCLIKNREHINVTLVNERGFNCLQWAALYGHVPSVNYIMKKYSLLADIESADGMSPLHLAAQQGRGRVLEAIAAGFKSGINSFCNGLSPLHYAVQNWDSSGDPIERVAAICVLIEKGADPKVCAIDSRSTPLHEAMKVLNAIADMVEFPAAVIVELQGLDYSLMRMEELLKRCRKFPQLAVVLYLLLKGASLDALDANGKKPTDYFHNQSFRYMWKHFTDAYQCNFVKPPAGDDRAKCTKCGQIADVWFQPCGHALCCQKCAKVISFRFCARCNLEVENMITTDGCVVQPVEQDDVGEAKANVADIEVENRRLRRRLEEAESAVLCVVCMDRKCDMLFSCGHMVCKQCGAPEKMHFCPTCRNPIRKRHVVFPQW